MVHNVIGMSAVLVVPLLLGLGAIYTNRWMEQRLDSLYRDRTSPDAQVRARCYVRENFFEESGVAQIMNETLSVFTITGTVIQVPLEQVKLAKFRRNNIFGRYPWWRKTCFWLDTPKTSGLVLGFSDPEPWFRVFGVK